MPDDPNESAKSISDIISNPDPIVLESENAVDSRLLSYLENNVTVAIEEEAWELDDGTHPAMIMASVARFAPPEHHDRIFSLIEQVHRDNVDLRRQELDIERINASSRQAIDKQDADTRQLTVTGGLRDRSHGRIAAFVFAVTLIGASTYLIMHNKDTAGLVGICATIAGIVAAMIAANVAQSKSGNVPNNRPNSDDGGPSPE